MSAERDSIYWRRMLEVWSEGPGGVTDMWTSALIESWRRNDEAPPEDLMAAYMEDVVRNNAARAGRGPCIACGQPVEPATGGQAEAFGPGVVLHSACAARMRGTAVPYKTTKD
jgi:hypothetical protein